jgi:hypothetical protein
MFENSQPKGMERRGRWGAAEVGGRLQREGSKSGSRRQRGESQRSAEGRFGYGTGRASTVREGVWGIMGNKGYVGVCLGRMGENDGLRLCDGRWDGRRHESRVAMITCTTSG